MPNELLVDGKLNIEMELEEFRQQWHDEIEQQQLYQELVPDGKGSKTVGEGTNSTQRSDQPSTEDQVGCYHVFGISSDVLLSGFIEGWAHVAIILNV